jgi:hypothetical protein
MLEPGHGGELRATATTPWVVQSANETRFGLAGARTIARKGQLELSHVPTPFRVSWAVRDGLFNDGWSQGVQPVDIDVFAVPKSEPRRRLLLYMTTGGIAQQGRYSVSVDGVTRARGRVAPGQTAVARVAVCVRPDAPSHVALHVRRAMRIPDGRLAGLLLARVESLPAGQC